MATTADAVSHRLRAVYTHNSHESGTARHNLTFTGRSSVIALRQIYACVSTANERALTRYAFVREKTVGREYDVFLGVAYGTNGKGKYNERKNRHISGN